MKKFLTAFALCFLALPVMAQKAPPLVTAQQVPTPASSTPPPVVMELFTSQGCSFCPPADALMGQMAQQQGVIALSCHVDYFNVRSNSLGKGFCTKRQNDYNRLIGTGPRYTPQLVVNGHMDMIGYEGGKVSAAILKGRGEKIFSIPMADAGNGAYSYTMPAAQTGGAPIKLWLAIYDRPHNMTITEGGNFGKKVKYYNVVSRLQDLGAWDGSAMIRAVNIPFTPANEGVALIVQNTATGKIIGAGQIKK